MIKTYTITVNESEQTVSRTNTGFSTIELLGLLVMAKESIINQIKNHESFENEFKEPVKILKTKIKHKQND
jgi:hypothetical protein